MFGRKKEEKNINNLNNNKRVIINSNAPRRVNNPQINGNVPPNYQNPNPYNQQPPIRNDVQQYSANPPLREMPRNNPQPPVPSQDFQNRQNNFNNNQSVPMNDQRNFNQNYNSQNNVEKIDYSHLEEQVNSEVQPSPNRRNRQPLPPRKKRGNGGKILYIVVLSAIVVGLVAYIAIAISQMI